MDENAKTRDLEEQVAEARHLWELGYGRNPEEWPDPLRKPREPTQDELDLLHSQMPGHRWDGWRRLTGDQDYYAACSCGWRSTDTGYVRPMLRQVTEHLDTVRQSRGWRPLTRPAQHQRDASQREMRPDERARELYASIESQQERLAQTAEHFSEVLAANQEQADRRVAALECLAERAAQEREQSPAFAQRAEDLQRRLERAKVVRKGIAAAASAMAVVAEEITWIHQDLETRGAGSAGKHRLADEASESAGTAREAERPLVS